MIIGPSVEKQFAIMKKWELSGEELVFMQILFLAKEDDEGVKYLYEYVNITKDGVFPLDMLKLLISKNILNKPKIAYPSTNDPVGLADFIYDYVDFNKMFLNGYLKESNILGQSLWDIYPPFMMDSKGNTFPLKNIVKGGFKNIDELFFKYGKEIKFDVDKHKEVLRILKEAKEKNLIQFNIIDFIITRKWEDLKQILNDPKFVTKFDNFKMYDDGQF